MIYEISKNADINYLAKIIEITTLTPIESSVTLQKTVIDGNTILIGNQVKKGDIMIYFPLECQINSEFLSKNNLFRKPELNTDPEAKPGFFEEKGRVKATKLMGIPSEGFCIPFSSLQNCDWRIIRLFPEMLNQEFDTINGVQICKKYRKPVRVSGQGNSIPRDKKIFKKLIDTQFRFHEETPQLGKYADMLSQNRLISITKKYHGSSGIISRVLGERELNFFEKILIKLGVNIPTTEYIDVYSSGKPKSKIPKGIVGKFKSKNQNFYPTDIWYESYKDLEPFLTNGLTIYYEIVGFQSNGGWIQGGYDYGCKNKEKKYFIYRITYTNDQGKVFEFSAKQVQEWCKKHDLNPVQQFYYGYTNDLYKLGIASDTPLTLEQLKDDKSFYMEENDPECMNKVPSEGIVVRFDDTLKLSVFKLKCFKFLKKESESLSKEETNLEEDE